MREAITVKPLDIEYTLEPDQDTPNGYHFYILGVEYKVYEVQCPESLQLSGIALNRCPNGNCFGCDSGFISFSEAVQFAEIYERIVKFVFDTEESQETATQRLINAIEDTKDMFKSRN